MYTKQTRASLAIGWRSLMILAILVVTQVSCENAEGLGGTGSISGNITEFFYNDDYSSLVHQSPAVDEEVFILFGNDMSVGQRVRTGSNGDFRFKYLYPGNYQVYYRSNDSTQVPDDGWSELVSLKLGDGEDRGLGNLEKTSVLEYDEGAATITGYVWKIKYNKDSYLPHLIEEYQDFAQEYEVYITAGNHDFIDDRVRTQDDGVFAFNNLIPGDYRVFLYSDDLTRVVQNVVVEFEVTITDFDQVIDLGKIIIEKI
jgi:hypothetical protein